jgi:hypothetical protein
MYTYSESIGAPHGLAAREIIMAALQAYHIPMSVARGAPLAKAGLLAGLGKAVLIGTPAVLVGLGLGYVLSKAFDVRWDEFSKRAADGESTMMRPSRKTRS